MFGVVGCAIWEYGLAGVFVFGCMCCLEVGLAVLGLFCVGFCEVPAWWVLTCSRMTGRGAVARHIWRLVCRSCEFELWLFPILCECLVVSAIIFAYLVVCVFVVCGWRWRRLHAWSIGGLWRWP